MCWIGIGWVWLLLPTVSQCGLHLVCVTCMRVQHQVKPKPCSALCTDFGSDPLHIARGPLLGYSKLEVMPLWQVLETFSSLWFRDFLSQSFAVPIYQVCYQCRRVSAGQPAILRWEHSWKAKLLMYFGHACFSYHYWIGKTVGQLDHTEFHITYKSSNLNL